MNCKKDQLAYIYYSVFSRSTTTVCPFIRRYTHTRLYIICYLYDILVMLNSLELIRIRICFHYEVCTMNSMINCVLNVPEQVFQNCLIPFLSLKDIVILDTATCNRKQRDELKLNFNDCIMHPKIDIHISNSMLIWLHERHIFVVNMVLSDKLDKNRKESLLRAARHMQKLTIQSEFQLFTSMLTNLLDSCKVLVVLNLYGDKFTDSVLMAIATHINPSLTSISVCDNSSVTDGGLVCLFQHCPWLLIVEVRTCKNITDVSVLRLAQYLSQLHTLRLVQLPLLTDRAVALIAQHMRQLRSLNLCHCHGIEGQTVMEIAQQCRQLEQLRVLNRKGAPLDPLLSTLSLHCPHLLKLHLSPCHSLTDSALICFAQHFPLLQDLTVFDAKQLTDTAVLALSQHCARLQIIFIAHSRLCTEASIVALATHCKELVCIYVTEIMCVSDVAMTAIAAHLCNIKYICISPCTKATDAGVAMIAHSCRLLQAVFFGSCSELTELSLLALSRHCTQLRRAFLTNATKIAPEYLKQLPKTPVFELS